MLRVRVLGTSLALLVFFSAPLAARDATPLVLARGARVGVVSVLDPELTHFHSGRSLQDTFLHTETLNWSTNAMLVDALKDRAAQMGLVLVPLAPTTELARARESCFLDGNFSKGLPKDCLAPLQHLGSDDRIQALILLAPGLNNSAHAGSTRRKDVPDYVRGWGFITGHDATPDGKPALFSLTELLLVAPSSDGPELHGREWGGNYAVEWTTFAPPPDLKAIPSQYYGELQPLFLGVLGRQTSRLLDQIQVGP
jgi:hypothetical protein